MIPFLDPDDPFPPVECALRDPNGLLAAGGDLSPARLLDAYAMGIFPWFGDEDPVLWWSPDPRMVLPPEDLHVSRSLRRTIRAGGFRVTMDECFPRVMESCAAPRPGQEGTWITDAMRRAYGRLFELGHAHSVETWQGEHLVGGLYGVALGRMFFGESMFASVTDASKVALVHLVRQLGRWRFPFVDCQMATAHLRSLGARELPRDEFLRRLREAIRAPGVAAPWRFDADVVNGGDPGACSTV